MAMEKALDDQVSATLSPLPKMAPTDKEERTFFDTDSDDDPEIIPFQDFLAEHMSEFIEASEQDISNDTPIEADPNALSEVCDSPQTVEDPCNLDIWTLDDIILPTQTRTFGIKYVLNPWFFGLLIILSFFFGTYYQATCSAPAMLPSHVGFLTSRNQQTISTATTHNYLPVIIDSGGDQCTTAGASFHLIHRTGKSV